MPTKLRKGRKYRGSRTCGYGKVGQHRDQGAKPERKAGRHKHKWSYVIRYEPDYFEKKGFTSPRSLRQRVKTINVRQLDEMARRLPEKQARSVIDLESMGFTKLLGSGKITMPLTVRVASASESASRKIKDTGGQIQPSSERRKE